MKFLVVCILVLIGIVMLSIQRSEGFFNASIISGRYITLQRPQVGWFNLADIQVFSKSGGNNIITPSTSVTISNPHPNGPALNFVDGKPNTIIHNNTVSSGGPLIVDLGSVVPIFKIIVTNRTDCCRERAVGTILTIQNQSNATIYTSDPITDKSGNNTFTELGGNNDTRHRFYNTFTYFPPNTSVLGDFVDVTMSGPAGPAGPPGPPGTQGPPGPATAPSLAKARTTPTENEDALLFDIQRMLRNDVLSTRQTTLLSPEEGFSSASMTQGQAYQQSCRKDALSP